MKKSNGFELFATDIVEFEKPGVLCVEFGGCGGDLCWEANGGEELVGEGGMDSVETLTSVVREAGVFVVE